MKLIINEKEIPVIFAKTFKERLFGLSFKKNINKGMLFKTKAIHTFFMKEKIDVLVLDKSFKILEKHLNIKSQIIINKKATYILELPQNTLKDNPIVEIRKQE